MHNPYVAVRKIAVLLLDLVAEHLRDRETVERAFADARRSVENAIGSPLVETAFRQVVEKFCTPR